MTTSVLIVAAGSGSRMRAPVPKPFLELMERPLLLWTLQTFQAHSLIDEIIVVVGEGDLDRAKALITFRDIQKAAAVVPGGATRQHSVLNGLEKVSPQSEIILIHDGARPFVTASLITSVVEGVLERGAALPLLPLSDTIKSVDGGGLVTGTLDRSSLRAAQTPQGFRASLIREVHERARAQRREATDDAALCEIFGHAVMGVPGQPENIKITNPEDMARAEAIAMRRIRESASSPL